MYFKEICCANVDLVLKWRAFLYVVIHCLVSLTMSYFLTSRVISVFFKTVFDDVKFVSCCVQKCNSISVDGVVRERRVRRLD